MKSTWVSWIAIGAIILVVLLFAYSYFHESPIRNKDSTGTTIVALGDSLVQGVGSTAGKDFVSLLAERIGLPIANLGVSGDEKVRDEIFAAVGDKDTADKDRES